MNSLFNTWNKCAVLYELHLSLFILLQEYLYLWCMDEQLYNAFYSTCVKKLFKESENLVYYSDHVDES